MSIVKQGTHWSLWYFCFLFFWDSYTIAHFDCFQARRAAADAAAGAAETIARVRLEAAANISESADRLVKVRCDVIICSIFVLHSSVLHC